VTPQIEVDIGRHINIDLISDSQQPLETLIPYKQRRTSVVQTKASDKPTSQDNLRKHSIFKKYPDQKEWLQEQEFSVALHLKSIDSAATMKEETIVLKDDNVVNTSGNVLFT